MVSITLRVKVPYDASSIDKPLRSPSSAAIATVAATINQITAFDSFIKRVNQDNIPCVRVSDKTWSDRPDTGARRRRGSLARSARIGLGPAILRWAARLGLGGNDPLRLPITSAVCLRPELAWQLIPGYPILRQGLVRWLPFPELPDIFSSWNQWGLSARTFHPGTEPVIRRTSPLTRAHPLIRRDPRSDKSADPWWHEALPRDQRPY